MEIWSEPTFVGEFIADANGDMNTTFTVPASITPGYHTLHLLGQDIAGEPIDVYKHIYVAESESDLDGDGVVNEQEECLIGEPSGNDVDRDGVDDACDGAIGESPSDTVAPTVVGQADREPNSDGWYNADVHINWTAHDAEPSSGTPSQPVATRADREGDQTYASTESCDPANNCATGNLQLKLDKTSPSVDYELSQSAEPNGWHNSDVTVSFHCDDAISGIKNCADPVGVSAEGVTIVTGNAMDFAGNTQEINVFVQIDQSVPVIMANLPAANENGWHNSDVSVQFECSDELSGVAECSQSVVLASEGRDQVVQGMVRDKAGNRADVEQAIHIDKTPPQLDALQGLSTPKATNVVGLLRASVDDNLSGAWKAEYFIGDTDPGAGNGAPMLIDLLTNEASVPLGKDFPTGVYKISVRAKDRAGNWSQVKSDYLVVYDPTGPRMTGGYMVSPSISNGDSLPGLMASRTDGAFFAFSINRDKKGAITKTSDFQFAYVGTCTLLRPSICPAFYVNATSIGWLTTQGTNNSTGVFQGTAKMLVGNQSQDVQFRITGVDGERLDTRAADSFQMQIFAANANPNSDQPIYKINTTPVKRGNIEIR